MDDNTVQVIITAQLDALKQGMSDAANSVRAGAEEMAGSLGGLNDIFDNLRETVMGLVETFGVFEGVKFGVELIKGGAEAGEQLTLLSQKTGIGVTELSRLQFAAKATGVEFGGFERAIGTLDEKLLELHSSTSTTLTAAFKQLNIDPSKITDAGDALNKISEALQRMGSTSQSIGAIRELLGGRGASFIPMLAQLQELREESDRLGVTLDSKTTEAATRAQEAFNLLGAEWDSAKTRITAALEPAIGELIKNAQDLVQEISVLSANGDLKRWAEESSADIKTLASDTITVVKALTEANDWLNKINPITASISAGAAANSWLNKINPFDAMLGIAPSGVWTPDAGRSGPSPESQVQDPLLKQAPSLAAAGYDAFAPWIENAQAAAKAAALLKQQLQQNFSDVEAQSKLEAAAAGDTANAKIEAARRVFLAAQMFFGSGSKQANTAEAALYGAENARDKENQAQQAEQLTTAEKYGVKQPNGQYVGGEAQLSQQRASTEQGLALKLIDPEQAAEQEKALDDKIYGLRENLYKQLAALYPADSKEAQRAIAEEAQAESEYATKQIEDQTKIATTSKQAAAEMAEAWRGALEPLMSSFDNFFDLIVQGTSKAKGSAEEMRLEMEKLERSTLLDLAKSGMKGVMFGGKEGTTQGALFGGGLVGEASQLAMGTGGGPGGGPGGTGAGNGGILGWLLGTSAATSMMSAMRGTGGNSGGLIGWLFGTASTAIMGALGMAPGAQNAKPSSPGAGSSVASAGAQVATGVVANVASGALSATEMAVPIVSAITAMTIALESSALGIVALLATANASLDMMNMELAEIDITDMLILTKPSIIGTTFAGGGIVSAAGGMVVGGGAYGGIPAILHAREMVLPRYLSEGFQRMLGSGDSLAGGEIHTHFHVTAMDAKSVSDFFDRNGDNIARSIHKNVRNQNPIMHAAIRMGSR